MRANVGVMRRGGVSGILSKKQYREAPLHIKIISKGMDRLDAYNKRLEKKIDKLEKEKKKK